MKKESLKKWAMFTGECAIGGIIGGFITLAMYVLLVLGYAMVKTISKR